MAGCHDDVAVTRRADDFDFALDNEESGTRYFTFDDEDLLWL